MKILTITSILFLAFMLYSDRFYTYMSPIEQTLWVVAYSLVMLVLSGLLFMWSLGKRPKNYKKELVALKKENDVLAEELSNSLKNTKRFHRENEDFRFYYGRMSKKYNELRASCRELLYPRNRYLSTHEGNLRNLNEVYVEQIRQ